MATKTAMESFSTPLPAPGDSCSLCEQRPLEHSANGVPWSSEIILSRKAYCVAPTQVQNLLHALTYLILTITL